jgi:hypothetical protein
VVEYLVKPRIKFLDVIIILLAAGLTFFSAFAAYIKPQGAARVLIRGQDSEWTFLLGAEETVVVRGPLGNTVVRIGENSAWVESSPCENQSCVAFGFLERQGQWAACLPNNVLLMIEAAGEEDIDAVAW